MKGFFSTGHVLVPVKDILFFSFSVLQALSIQQDLDCTHRSTGFLPDDGIEFFSVVLTECHGIDIDDGCVPCPGIIQECRERTLFFRSADVLALLMHMLYFKCLGFGLLMNE